jgi:hypothetical protein
MGFGHGDLLLEPGGHCGHGQSGNDALATYSDATVVREVVKRKIEEIDP